MIRLALLILSFSLTAIASKPPSSEDQYNQLVARDEANFGKEQAEKAAKHEQKAEALNNLMIDRALSKYKLSLKTDFPNGVTPSTDAKTRYDNAARTGVVDELFFAQNEKVACKVELVRPYFGDSGIAYTAHFGHAPHGGKQIADCRDKVKKS